MSESTATLSPCTLVVTHETGSTSQHPLIPGRSVVLGSSPHCGIQVVGKAVASMHCLIDFNDDVVGIQDWASSTGTIVNGSPITSKISVSENDEVKIGKAVISIRRAGNSLAKDDSGDDAEDQQASSSSSVGSGARTEQVSDPPRETVEADIDDLEPVDDAGAAPSAEVLAEDRYDWNADFDDAEQFGMDDWDGGVEQYDADTVQLLKAEIDDLRSMLADRDLQLEELSSAGEFEASELRHQSSDQTESSLQQRVDQLLAEAAEEDERFRILQDLLEAAELKNQAEGEERQALEAWVGEIEQRIGQRESEWKAELEAVRDRLEATEAERNQLQHQLRDVASRFGAQDVYGETLDKLQSRNATLQDELSKTKKQAAAFKQKLDNVQNCESEEIQKERALIAKERASVSRMRFELSQKLSEFEQAPLPMNTADREVSLRIQNLRTHLREINEQEQLERQGQSLFTRISGMWKRMEEDRY